MRIVYLLSLLCLTSLLASCVEKEPVGNCQVNAQRCAGSQIERCAYGRWLPNRSCEAPAPICVQSEGVADCRACQPGEDACVGASIYSCNADGSLGAVIEECPAAQICTDGYCGLDPCVTAAQTASYIGCTYWAVSTINPELTASFDDNFAVAVHNDNPTAASVTITRGEAVLAARDVEAGALEIFTLPFVQELKQTRATMASVIMAGGAYKVQSNRPVTVYQFNPLDYHSLGEFSYTNDAALLLPVHALSGNYIAMARATHGVESQSWPYLFAPGFLTVVGTEPDTSVTIQLASHTMAGAGVSAAVPGQQQTFTLDAGEVLQILSGLPTVCLGTETTDDCNGGVGVTCSYCDQGVGYDLTGSIVSSSAPVAVFSGHACTFVPAGTWACDHLEEQMIPLETWGKTFVVGRTEPQHAPLFAAEPNVIRLVSGTDNNVIRFDPPQSVGAEVTLHRGAWLEFETWDDFTVDASEAVMIGQFLVGQSSYSAPDSVDFVGDPAYALMVPVEQFRTQYTFYAPRTMPNNYVTVIAPVGEGSPVVYLDDEPINASLFTPSLSGSGFGVARVPISGESHEIHADSAFGIIVYGFASYTSYSYPGGLDLRHINPVN